MGECENRRRFLFLSRWRRSQNRPLSCPHRDAHKKATGARADVHLSDEARADVDLSYGARAYVNLSDEARAYVHLSDEARAYVHLSDEARAYVDLLDEARADVHLSYGARAYVHLSDEARAYVHLSDEARAYVDLSDEARADVHLSDEARADVHLSDEARADVYKRRGHVLFEPFLYNLYARVAPSVWPVQYTHRIPKQTDGKPIMAMSPGRTNAANSSRSQYILCRETKWRSPWRSRPRS